MPEKLNLTKQEIQLLVNLTTAKIPYMIVGMGSAILQGAPLGTQDLDLWIKNLGDPQFHKVIRDLGGAYVAPIMSIQNPPQVVGEGFMFIDFVTSMSGLDSFDEEYKNAINLDYEGIKLKLLPLERVIKSKTAAHRPKDKMALPALKSTLETLRKNPKMPKIKVE